MKILMIGAHQDDNEFCCGGIAHKYVKAGHTVKFLSMCNGNGGHHIMTPKETSERRAKESLEVARFLGIEYEVWDIDDCTLMPDLPTRMKLISCIREFCPDLVIAHRPNDYHADHRASAQLVQDASYLLIVPHTCPEVPAMKKMPVIMYNEDRFTNPPFRADVIFDIDDEIENKIHIASLNESQVYEWLPYTDGEEVPVGKEERYEWLKGMDTSTFVSDEEVMQYQRGYAVDSAKTAARFREKLIQKYGVERGSRVRFAEAFEICEYGTQPDERIIKELFSF